MDYDNEKGVRCVRRETARMQAVCASIGAQVEVGSGSDEYGLLYDCMKITKNNIK